MFHDPPALAAGGAKKNGVIGALKALMERLEEEAKLAPEDQGREETSARVKRSSTEKRRKSDFQSFLRFFVINIFT